MSGIVNRTQRCTASAFFGCLLVAGLVTALTPQPASANPTGQNVTVGTATFDTVGSTLTVTNAPGAIIHWDDFSIAAGETTIFNQQNALSTVLNRVIGVNPSSILGALQSNGKVFLINPNGILFGQSAQVDVGGLVASTLEISDLDFTNGFLNFTAGANAGSVENQGTITAASGGEVYMVAKDVTNSGLITAPDGRIVLAAGSSVMLYDPVNPWMGVTVESGPDDQAINLSDLVAPNGRIDMYGALVRQGGMVSADSAEINTSGVIFFRSSGATIFENGSTTTVSDGNTYSSSYIEVHSIGDITLGGTIDAGAGDVWLETDGSIIDNHTGGPDVAAGYLTMRAYNGIGSGDPLETKVDLLEARNYSSGNVEISNSLPLNLGWDGIWNQGGDVVLSNTGDLYFDTSIFALGDLNLTVTNGDLIGGYNGEMQEWGFLEASLLTLDLDGSTLEGDFYGYQPVTTYVSSVDITGRGAGSVGINNFAPSEVLDVRGIRSDAVATARVPVVEIFSDADLDLSGPIVAPGSNVSLSATWGIYDLNDVGFDVDALGLTLSAADGIGSGNPLETRVGELAAVNSSLGSIEIANTGDLLVLTLSNFTAGINGLNDSIVLDNIGAVTFAEPAAVGNITVAASAITGPYYPEFAAPNGDFVVTAHSPLTVSSAGISAGGDILLTAGASGFGDNLTINGDLTSLNGMIGLSAGDAIIEAPGITLSAPGGILRTEHLNTQTPGNQETFAFYEAITPVLVGLDSILEPAGDPNTDPDQTTSEGETSEQTATTYCN